MLLVDEFSSMTQTDSFRVVLSRFDSSSISYHVDYDICR